MAAGEDGLPVYPHDFSSRIAYVCLTGAPSDDMRSLDPNREECFQVEEAARGLSSEWAGAPAENGFPYNYSEARFASFNCNAIFRSSYIKREGICWLSIQSQLLIGILQGAQRAYILANDLNPIPQSTQLLLLSKKSDSAMLLPYVADPPPTTTLYEAEILERVQARRAPNGLLPLDRALLHSFPIAEGWNTFFGAIRQRTSLTPVISELIMCRVAVLNGAWFEWEHHSPLLTEAVLSDAAVSVVRDSGADIPAKVAERVLSPAEGAVLRYTDAMTKTIAVPDKVSKALRELFSDREVVEITATCPGYNCVSRFLVALDIGEKNQ